MEETGVTCCGFHWVILPLLVEALIAVLSGRLQMRFTARQLGSVAELQQVPPRGLGYVPDWRRYREGRLGQRGSFSLLISVGHICPGKFYCTPPTVKK